MKITQAVITAAGFGSRFLPVVKSVPKEMLPIIDKPIIHYLVDECIEAGLEEIIIVVRKGIDTIDDYFHCEPQAVKELLSLQGKIDRYQEVQNVLDIKGITIIEQDPVLPYGNGSPVLSAKHLLKPDQPFVLLWGDDMVLTTKKGAVAQLLDFWQTHECDAVTAVQKMPKEELNRYGVIKPINYNEADGEGVYSEIVEKPAIEDAPSDLVSYGRMIIPFKIFDYLTPSATGKDNELWLQDANDKLARNGKFMFKVLDGEFLTTGDPLRYLEALSKFYLKHPKYGPEAAKIFAKVIA